MRLSRPDRFYFLWSYVFLLPQALALISPTMVIALNVKFVVKPEHKEDLLCLLKTDGEQTLATEPGALQFVLGQDTTHANVIHLHEQYRNMEAVQYHRETAHFLAYREFCSTVQPFQEEPVIHVYECQHDSLSISPRAVFCLNVESCVKPELRDEFMTLMQSHQQKSKSEPACLQFDWGIGLDDPNSFYIHEQYADAEGFRAHESSSHFATFVTFNQNKNPYQKPQVVDFFSTIPW